MSLSTIKLARFSEDYSYIIDSDDRHVALDDPRVVHFSSGGFSTYSKRFTMNIYEKFGRRYRSPGLTNKRVMQYAKELCSGRECVPFIASTGDFLNDIHNHYNPEDVTVYISLNQEGPCQNAAWPVVWQTFAERLNLKNILFMPNTGAVVNLLGLSKMHMRMAAICTIVGHFLDEAENALRVVARDKDSALKAFSEATDRLIESVKTVEDKKDFDKTVTEWAESVAKIPLKAAVEKTPKVLIFGGLNIYRVHSPITSYFLKQGVIPKVVDFTEGLLWIQSEKVARFGFKKGKICPSEQFDMTFLEELASSETEGREEAKATLGVRNSMAFLDHMMSHYRKLMESSGLLFDEHMSYPDLVEAGHEYVSCNGFHETSSTTGKYVLAVEQGLFDGLINLGSFSCQPAMNSQAIIRPLANANDVPYAAIDVEGPWISTNQCRLLETIAVQAKRSRQKKNSIVS